MDISKSIHEDVKDYYGKIIQKTDDLKTSACTSNSSKILPFKSILKFIPSEILEKFYGCGVPIPLGISGLRVLDLGCGTGRDCYICSALVGASGFVLGIDMTESQIAVANKYMNEYTNSLNYSKPNMSFIQGYIEDLSMIESNSIDLVISNCVINLSPRKDLVLREVFRVLKEGGEMYFSDVYSDRRMKKEALENKVLYGECISGALYINDFITLCKEVGFKDPRVIEQKEIQLNGLGEFKKLLGETRFFSISYRLFKIKDLEPYCEDYGQFAVYKGTINGMESCYILDNHHKFEKNKPKLVCGNTASMLKESWLGTHFNVIGDRTEHFGIFPCENTINTNEKGECEEGSCQKEGKSCCS